MTTKNCKSFNTAISRKNPSAPLKQLESMMLLKGSILDYGCGKGADAKYLNNSGANVKSYDPYWNPISLKGQLFDTVLCTYVANVISKEEEQELLSSIKSLLKKDGKAYITVRRDIKKEGVTSRGFQRNVELDLPIVKEKKNNYCIYMLQ